MMARLIPFIIPTLTLLGGIPLRLGWVPPNRWYGYRTALTMRDTDTWYVVNRDLGAALILAGVLGVVVSLLISRVMPSWREDTRLLTTVIVQGLIVLMLLLVVVLRTHRV